MRKTFMALGALLLLAVPALAHDGVHLENGTSRAAIAGGTGIGLMTIRNTGPEDRLVSASSPVAESVELHTTVRGGNVAGMVPVASMVIPANGTVYLSSDGNHLMLNRLKLFLRPGDSVPVTLVFERAGSITTTLQIGSMRTSGSHNH